MGVAIDYENIISRSLTCKFGEKCLEEFDSSLCCEIIREGEDYLVVSPVSTFKSTNCSFVKLIRYKNSTHHICTCPIRLEIYRKYAT